MSEKTGLDLAKEAAGGANALGRLLGITGQAVAKWEKIPAERVPEVGRLTGISRADLRPDLWGAP